MPNASNIELLTDRYGGTFDGVDFNVSAFRSADNDSPQNVVLYRGGLLDIRTSSLVELAKRTVIESEGEIVAGAIRTERPLMPHDAIAAAMQAREQRARSAGGALLQTERFYQGAENIVVAGQSQGGVSAVDGILRATNHKGNNQHDKDINIRALTIDTPGVYGQLDTSVVPGLVKLGLHCLPDLFRMGNVQRSRMIWDTVKRGYSPYEAMFVLGEIAYLSTIDLRPELEQLDDAGIDRRHAWHSLDVVPGAAEACDRSVVFDGGHLQSLHGKGADEMAKYVVSLFGDPSPKLSLVV